MAQPTKTGTAVAPNAGQPKAFPPLDASTFVPQLVWLALTFGFLYWMLAKIALPRIGGVLGERADRIKRDLDEAERLKSETAKALAAYEQSLAEAKAKAGGMAKDTRERLAAEIEHNRQQGDQQNAAKIAEMEKRIALNKARAMASVNDIAVDIAGAVVAKLTGQAVSADEMLRDVGSGAAST